MERLGPIPAPASGARPKVIYVMGAGRSGSTIVGVALGNCRNIFYAGELDAWLRRSGIPNFGGVERTQFWLAVGQNVPSGPALFGDSAWRCLEHALAPFRFWQFNERRHLRRRYRQTAAELYRAITRISRATHIVDTSHYPLRARELRRLPDIDLYLVYLVRDPKSVVASFRRHDVSQPSKSLVAANVYLALTNLLSVLVFLRHRTDRRVFVRYEDFVKEPAAQLRNILAQVDAVTPLPDLESLDTGVAFQGNRILRSTSLTLGAATTPGRAPRSRVTQVLQLPWSLVFSQLQPTATAMPSPKGGYDRGPLADPHHRGQSRPSLIEEEQ